MKVMRSEFVARYLRWAMQWIVLACACTGCTESPSIPLPEEAIPLRTPRDIDGVWLDVQEQKVRERLTSVFGRVTIAEYRLEGWTWEALESRFDDSMTSQSLQRFDRVPLTGRHYRVAVWSRKGKAARPMVALVEVMQPYSVTASHRVVLVITPQQD